MSLARKMMKKRPVRQDMELQITSMADIFTIILVFLLKSFSTGVSTLTPSVDLTLPAAAPKDQMTESLKIEISPQAVLIDDKAITELIGFQFDSRDLESDGTPHSLNEAFAEQMEQERSRQPAEIRKARANGHPSADEPPLPKLIVMADEKTPYTTLKAVLASAANSGYGEFKLVVVEDK